MRVVAENDGFKVVLVGTIVLKNGPKDGKRVFAAVERDAIKTGLLRGMARTLEDLPYSDFGIESIKVKK